MTALIELRGAGKSFANRTVLQAVNLNLVPGRIVTLIGPNGAGKTTLVKIVLGLLQPDTGSVQRSVQLRVGYMPQKLHIDPTLPLQVDRFLQFANADTAVCLAALDRVGIAHLIKQPVSGLSGGEMQRMLLARALLRKPNLLVLDEPVQGVDVTGQEALYQLIGELRDELNCGILMVSHDLHLVMAATDEVVCLNQHVCCHGTPQQVSVDPEFVALFGAKTALYTHHHDHEHGLHSGVVNGATSGLRDATCSHDTAQQAAKEGSQPDV
ncbi:zinc ABC transporter ATP-binding protein ZnuC [Gammaproteobacteria bacterium 50_400_T64]|nr:zinc ABC transporter ATP-binding protein ZnuC [Gammaproteobacteria bacterium 50_400_T64]